MKLYRGLKSSEFKVFDTKLASHSVSIWEKILKERIKGNFHFPEALSKDIVELEKINRLRRQNFTDNKSIALAYAKENRGLLLEIDVNIGDVLKYFHLEFQNFGKRKKNFELVYVVDAASLFRNAKKWKLKEICPRLEGGNK